MPLHSDRLADRGAVVGDDVDLHRVVVLGTEPGGEFLWQHDALPDLALLRPDIPAYLLAAVRGALAKDPAGRWRDGADFLARLTPAPVALPAPQEEGLVAAARANAEFGTGLNTTVIWAVLLGALTLGSIATVRLVRR